MLSPLRSFVATSSNKRREVEVVVDGLSAPWSYISTFFTAEDQISFSIGCKEFQRVALKITLLEIFSPCKESHPYLYKQAISLIPGNRLSKEEYQILQKKISAILLGCLMRKVPLDAPRGLLIALKREEELFFDRISAKENIAVLTNRCMSLSAQRNDIEALQLSLFIPQLVQSNVTSDILKSISHTSNAYDHEFWVELMYRIEGVEGVHKEAKEHCKRSILYHLMRHTTDLYSYVYLWITHLSKEKQGNLFIALCNVHLQSGRIDQVREVAQRLPTITRDQFYKDADELEALQKKEGRLFGTEESLVHKIREGLKDPEYNGIELFYTANEIYNFSLREEMVGLIEESLVHKIREGLKDPEFNERELFDTAYEIDNFSLRNEMVSSINEAIVLYNQNLGDEGDDESDEGDEHDEKDDSPSCRMS